jgi:flagellar hook-associated protein 2
MAGLSSPGIGSGLDVNSIVTQLVSLERRPIQNLQVQAATLQTRLSGIGQLQGSLSGLQDAAKKLATASTYEAMNVTSSDSTSVTASLASGSTPALGSFSVGVTSLAAGQTLVSGSGQFTASTQTVGSGTLTLTLGEWKLGDVFEPKSGSTPSTVTIAAGDSLSAIRDKINAANAGVSASLVTDANGVRLSLQSTATGAVNGFRLTVADDDGLNADGAGLSRLAYDPQNAAAQMSRTVSAADAVATVNGIEVKSASNVFTGALQGVSFTARKVTTANLTLSVGKDTASVRQAVNGFVSAYNTLAKFLSDQTKYDPATKQAGMFQGNSAVVGIFNQLKSTTVASTTASATFSTLSSMGIEMQRDGTLQVASAKLDKALNNLDDMKTAMTASSLAPGAAGLGKRFQTMTDGLLAVTGGTVPNMTKSLKSQLDANQKDQTRYQERVAAVEKRLRKEYSSLDTTIAKFNSLNSYVSQQMSMLQKSSSGNR